LNPRLQLIEDSARLPVEERVDDLLVSEELPAAQDDEQRQHTREPHKRSPAASPPAGRIRDRGFGQDDARHARSPAVRAYARSTSSRSDSQISWCSSRKRGSNRISCTAPRGRGRSIS